MSAIVLDELKSAGIVPVFAVTTPDKPRGHKLVSAPNVVKVWAKQNNLPVFDFAKFDAPAIGTLAKETGGKVDFFLVASYGKILPSSVINLPKWKTLNIHPSLLPKYRGPAPLQQAMLDDSKKTGLTIMRIDEQMDHGPIVAQRNITVAEWPAYEEFEEEMARNGARLLIESAPEWISGRIKEVEQDHSKATYTGKFRKEDGLMDLADAQARPYDTFRKIQAFHEWPQAYFMVEHNGRKIRVKIISASFADGRLAIESVIPEGSRPMKFGDFKKGYGLNWNNI